MPSRSAATQEPMSPTTGATISTLVSISLGSMSIWMNFFECGSPQALALAVRQQPVEAGADQHDDVGVFQHRRARRAGALRMGVGQQPLGHAHRQKRNAALFDQGADRVVGLRVGRTLAEDNQWPLGAFEHVERALDRGRRGNLRRRRVDDLDQRLFARLGIHHLPEQLGRQIEIDAARTARHRGADRARQADADVGGMQNADRPPCTAAWRWRAGPSPRSRPAASRRSRARTSPRSGSSESSWSWRGRARSVR